MKKALLSLIAVFVVCFSTYAQNTPWNTNSSIGIGTTNPQSIFQVFGGNATLWGITLGLGTSNAVITTDDATKPISFQIASNEMMRVAPNGNVGIGQNNPQAKLDVAGAIFSSGAESHFTFNTYADPVPGIAYAIKVGSNGIAVNGNSVFNSGLSIGTANLNGYLLAVKGGVHAQSVTIDLNNWADYVFNPTYKLRSLSYLKTYIDQNHHLPDMPSEEEVKNKGVDLGEMVKLQTKKIEELTLYLIEKDKELNEQHTENSKLKEQIAEQTKLIESIAKRLNAVEQRVN